MKMNNGFTFEELYTLAWEKPILAQIELTRNCNQSCSFCFRSCEPQKIYEDLSLENWKDIIKDLISIGVRRIDFSGGESFLFIDFVELIIWTKSKGIEVNVNTNGSFDVTSIVSFVDNLIFSVHGLGNVHNKIVGKKNFDKLEKNIFISTNQNVKTTINMCLVKSNFEQIIDVYEYFSKRYDIYQFAPFMPVQSLYGGKYADALVINENNIQFYIKCLKMIPMEKLKLKHGLQSIMNNDQGHYNNENIQLPNCAAGKYKLIVDYDGSVYPCHFFKGKEFFCGNLTTKKAIEIWRNGLGFQKFRKIILENQIDKKCKSCTKRFKCFSGCQAWSENYLKGEFGYGKDKRCSFGNAYIGN